MPRLDERSWVQEPQSLAAAASTGARRGRRRAHGTGDCIRDRRRDCDDRASITRLQMHLSAATEESDEHYRDIKPPPYFAAMHSVFICRLLAHADHEGRTALHIAASEGRFRACRFFVINPCGLPAPRLSSSGESPADCVKANGHHRVADYLFTSTGTGRHGPTLTSLVTMKLSLDSTVLACM